MSRSTRPSRRRAHWPRSAGPYARDVFGAGLLASALVALVVAGSDTRIMGRDAVRGGLRAAGWTITGVITLFSIVYLVQQVIGG
jgi:Mn2+/Fe2+ NRAMP family transporter